MNLLDAPLSHIKGVGPKSAEQLSAAGLRTVRDLILFLPRKHEDFSRVQSIAHIQPGNVSVRGSFSGVQTKRVRRGMTVTQAVLDDGTAKVPVVWFNQSYRAAQLETGKEFLVSGEFGLQRQRYQIVNPSVELAKDIAVSGGRIVPVYPAIKGLKSQLVRKILIELRPAIMGLVETLPETVITREDLMSRADAVLAMHFPDSNEQLERARDRLGFEEVFALMVASQLNRQDNAALESHTITFNPDEAKEFVAALPFLLTDAQRVAAWESIQSLEKGEPMNRMLQGDVGSGKTVVAGLVAYIAAKAGFQTAFMAPTELLATQHASTLSRLLEPFGLRVGLLIGSLSTKQRKPLVEAVANGQCDIVVGTHALFQDKVSFHRLGFVVIDEQHRFGVEQRQKLLAKGHKMPHLLAMTATPIPRSLQLTVYGELDISILNQKPAARKDIETHIISPNSRDAMYDAIEVQLAMGRQAYVICPRIEAGDDEQASVEEEQKRLQRSVFKHRRIGLLHGKLSAEAKDDVMRRFASGDLDILVSTTVVEVGVDVPNATAIIIEGADRFGLAQLHQLRGRVGRSELQSYCYLVPSTSLKPSERLRELERSNDGFYLAERDLEIRGPGEIYGRAQSGALNLAIANIADTKLLKRAQTAAAHWLDSGGDLLQYEQLKTEVDRYRRLTTLN
ncbi:TPA: DNA helicase RecG [Candidatus Saccharibacteria bacterium]|nr:DNA helicase RecG [Candidatus Saccharibacteria bacterium]HRK41190.1 ATP-dependent DNA helicase RecG [Candidatus Saccharibacteria bacterium]